MSDCSDCPVLETKLFRTLPQEVRERATCLFKPLTFEAGMPVYVAGLPAHSVFAIRSGTCKAVSASPGGREQVLRAYGPGDMVGLDGIFVETYPHTLSTATRTRICHASRTEFRDFTVLTPEFATEVIRHLSEELAEARDALAARSGLGTRARLARLLLQQRSEDADEAVSLPLNQRDTAGLLGMAEESLSRQLAALEREGVVGRQGRRLVLKDLDALRRLAES